MGLHLPRNPLEACRYEPLALVSTVQDIALAEIVIFLYDAVGVSRSTYAANNSL